MLNSEHHNIIVDILNLKTNKIDIKTPLRDI